MSNTDVKHLEYEYPSVDLAYPIAIASYDVAAKRLEIMDNRLQTMMAYVVSVSIVVPSIANGHGASFRSVWFYASLLFFIAGMVIGIYARITGKARTLRPSFLYEKWLGDSPWEFKKNMIYHAGIDFDTNIKLVSFRWRCSVALILLFALEALSLTAWVSG